MVKKKINDEVKGKPANERDVYGGRSEEFPALGEKLFSEATSNDSHSIFVYRYILAKERDPKNKKTV